MLKRIIMPWENMDLELKRIIMPWEKITPNGFIARPPADEIQKKKRVPSIEKQSWKKKN